MKLLHTSDWHVGKAIRGASRADEHRAVLDEIAAIAAAEDVDVVVVAGDLFDTSTPSPESEEIVYRALLALARHRRRPSPSSPATTTTPAACAPSPRCSSSATSTSSPSRPAPTTAACWR